MRWPRSPPSGCAKPVKWMCDRSEHFLGDSHGRDNISTARLALDDKGRFLALDLDIVADMGAYLSCYAPYIPWLGAGMATGAYDIPAAHVRLRAAYTNTVPVDAYRGAGTAGSLLSDRAAGRCCGARARHRARRAAPKESDQAEGDAIHDADRQNLRLRRFRRLRWRARRRSPTGMASTSARRHQGAPADCAASASPPMSRPAAITDRKRRTCGSIATAASPC